MSYSEDLQEIKDALEYFGNHKAICKKYAPGCNQKSICDCGLEKAINKLTKLIGGK